MKQPPANLATLPPITSNSNANGSASAIAAQQACSKLDQTNASKRKRVKRKLNLRGGPTSPDKVKSMDSAARGYCDGTTILPLDMNT